MTRHRRHQQPDAERGAIGVFLAVLVPGLLLIIRLAVDGGAKVAATQRANAIADEAARAAGQALDVSAALTGEERVTRPPRSPPGRTTSTANVGQAPPLSLL